jgi:RNA polymerase-binding transcription factor DksA
LIERKSVGAGAAHAHAALGHGLRKEACTMDMDTQTHLRSIRAALLCRLAGHQANAAAGNQTQRLSPDELVHIEQALRRLDAGRYGDCQDCGRSIGWQRLQIQPAAPRCATCQSASELTTAQDLEQAAR